MASTPLRPAANPRKTRSVRVLGPVDVAALREAALAVPEAVWDAENARKPNNFDVLGQTRHIVFRFIQSPHDWRTSYDCPPWPQWRTLVEPVLRQASRAFGYAADMFPRVMLARLPAGGLIKPHVDANPAAKWPHKVHIPLTTNPDVISFFGGAQHHFTVGEAVEVDNLGPHWVSNGGAEDRIHLIFEYYDPAQPDPAWLAPLLAGGTPP